MTETKKSFFAQVRHALGSEAGKFYVSRAAALLAVIVCLIMVYQYAAVLMPEDAGDIAYPLEQKVNAYNPYVQQFDALRKGQTNIDYPADPRLDELENVYDYEERKASGLYYLWDRAYYEGKYYSYFGLTPLLTVYYPYYFLNGSLPTDTTVMTVFLFVCAVFLPLCVFQWAWNFAPKTPVILLLFAAPAAFFGSLMLLIARGYTPFYYIAVIAGGAFLSLFLWLCLAAWAEKTRWLRLTLWALAGVAYGLVFQARINIAFLAAFLVLPGLWFFIIGKKREGKDASGRGRWIAVLSELCALGLPVLLFLCGSLIFNAKRFSGPLDFGTAYQLTIADTSTYRIRLTDLPFAIYHYLLAAPANSKIYPYVSFNYVRMSDYGHYVYRDAGLGMFSSPLMYGMLLFPALVGNEEKHVRRRVMVTCGVVGIFATALLDFCLGGIIYRYTADMTVVGALLAVIVLLSLFETADERGNAVVCGCLAGILILFFAFSAVAALRVSLINDNGNIVKFSEETAGKLMGFFNFKPPKE